MKRFIGPAIIILVIALFVVMVVTSKTNKAESEYIEIYATSYPSYDFARAIVKDTHISVQQIITPGTDLHSFEPAPEDLLYLNKSKIIVATCGESEKWLDEISAFIDAEKTEKICIMDYVDAAKESDKNILQPEKKTTDEYDEHVWTSPKNAIKIVKALKERIKTVFPEQSEQIDKNTDEYISKLEELDKSFEKLAQSATKPLIVADRFPFYYLVHDYNLDYYAAFPGCAEESEASASTIAKLIDIVKEKQISTIFTIELSDQKVAKTIAEATGAEVSILHSAHNITSNDYENGATYYDLMKYNLGILEKALK